MDGIKLRTYDPKKPGYGPRLTPEEWEHFRPFLTGLHEQGLSRRQIIKIAKEQQGFQGTYSSLNKRFEEWGLTNPRNATRHIIEQRTDSDSSRPIAFKPKTLTGDNTKPKELPVHALSTSGNVSIQMPVRPLPSPSSSESHNSRIHTDSHSHKSAVLGTISFMFTSPKPVNSKGDDTILSRSEEKTVPQSPDRKFKGYDDVQQDESSDLISIQREDFSLGPDQANVNGTLANLNSLAATLYQQEEHEQAEEIVDNSPSFPESVNLSDRIINAEIVSTRDTQGGETRRLPIDTTLCLDGGLDEQMTNKTDNRAIKRPHSVISSISSSRFSQSSEARSFVRLAKRLRNVPAVNSISSLLRLSKGSSISSLNFQVVTGLGPPLETSEDGQTHGKSNYLLGPSETQSRDGPQSLVERSISPTDRKKTDCIPGKEHSSKTLGTWHELSWGEEYSINKGLVDTFWREGNLRLVLRQVPYVRLFTEAQAELQQYEFDCKGIDHFTMKLHRDRDDSFIVLDRALLTVI